MCDATTGWAGGIAQLDTYTDVKIEGSACLAAWIDNTTSAIEYYTITSVDLSGGEHIYMWMMCSGVVDTKANGGYRIVAYSGTAGGSNYMTWYVGGNDTHGTGWLLLCCDVSASGSETGTFDPTDVVAIGIQFKTTTAALKRGQTYMHNCFWDAVRYGTGSVVTSASTDDADYEDIYDDEINDNYFGVIQKSYGSYIQTGKIILGGTGTETCDFVIDNELVIFPSNDKVASDFYEILPLGNATNPTYVIITGSVIKAAGSEKFTIDSSGANINTFTITGSTLNNGGTITFLTGQTITAVVFTGCDTVDPNGATLSECTIENATVTGTSAGSLMVNVDTEGESCSDINFKNYPGSTTYAVYVAASVTEFDMDNWQFDDPNNTTSYAVYWAGTGGTLTINALNGTNLVTAGCTSAGGTVTVVNSVTLTVTVKRADTKALISNAEVAIYKASDDSELMNELTVSGVATEVFAYPGTAVDIYWRVR